MSSDLMRRYIDILNENAQPQQLDEGVMDALKSLKSSLISKVKQIPKFDQAYEIAKQHTADIKDIIKSSNSGEEVVDKIKQLASGSNLAEDSKLLAATGLTHAAYMGFLYKFGVVVNGAFAAVQSGIFTQDQLVMVVTPIALIIFSLIILLSKIPMSRR